MFRKGVDPIRHPLALTLLSASLLAASTPVLANLESKGLHAFAGKNMRIIPLNLMLVSIMGSATAQIAIMSRVMTPELERDGYDKGFAAALTADSGLPGDPRHHLQSLAGQRLPLALTTRTAGGCPGQRTLLS